MCYQFTANPVSLSLRVLPVKFYTLPSSYASGQAHVWVEQMNLLTSWCEILETVMMQ